jgi:alanyl-tRNA synthetase
VTKTARLVYEDPGALAFEAVVVESVEPRGAAGADFSRGATVELDRTAFYAEGGGQPADHGELSWGSTSTRVIDVQVDEDGRVHHRVEGPLPPAGALVHGRIERARRLELTALHTAQHTLSRALELEAAASTVSARLGSTATIDVARVDVPEADLVRAEDLANSIVDDDVEVRVWYPSELELGELPLRKKGSTKVFERIRVVAVGRFDVTPCGGTHCARSSAMGLVAITGVERYKGMTRISFTAGARGRRDVVAAHRRLATLTRLAGGDVETALTRAKAELLGAREERAGLQSQLAALLAAELLPGLAQPVAAFVRDDLDVGLLRDVVARLAKAAPDRTIVGVGGDRGGRPVVVRGSGTPSAQQLVGVLTARLGGRGGGKPELAEGRIASGADVSALGALLEP